MESMGVWVPSLAGIRGTGLQSEYCVGGAWPGRYHKCLWISGLKGSSHGDPAVLRSGSLG
jgi:hypothetical protein